MDESAIKRLTDKVERLLAHCSKLESDNAELRALQNDWQSERSKLLQKNDLARNKIEAMIGRLKSLEQS
ncbi:MAG: TIGR02449 family protein [Oleiphilus sp.]|nr:MAG: TIGR02449 family protein [Oleiphilus sp.]